MFFLFRLYIHTRAHTHIRRNEHSRMHTRINQTSRRWFVRFGLYMHTRTHSHTHTHTRTHTHTYTHTHTHTHTHTLRRRCTQSIRVTWLMYMCAVTCEPPTCRAFVKCHVTLWHDSCVCGMTHACVWHYSCVRVMWLIHMCDVTHIIDMTDYPLMCRTHMESLVYAWCDSCICVTWLMHMRDKTGVYVDVTWYPLMCLAHMESQVIGHDSYIYVTWLVHMCDVSHIYVWHDSCIYVTWLIHIVTWLIHICDMTHSYMWLESYICVTSLTCMHDVTHSPLMCSTYKNSQVTLRPNLCMCVTWLMHLRDMTHIYVWQDWSIYVPGPINLLRAVLSYNHMLQCEGTRVCVMWLMYICDMNHVCVWQD